LVIFDKDFFLS